MEQVVFWFSLIVPSFMLFVVPAVSSPSFLGLMCFSCSLGVSLSVGLTQGVWWGAMVWMVYVSALLIMFLYFTALTPNPDFEVDKSVAVAAWMVGIVAYFTADLTCPLYLVGKNFISVGSTNFKPYVFLWSGNGCYLVLFLAMFLFFAAVVVSKVASRSGGALRMYPRLTKGDDES